jgi:inosine/xanthosine triphosphatase
MSDALPASPSSGTAPSPPAAAAAAARVVRVVVGSTNKVKVESARRAFALAFPGATIEVQGASSPSGVSDQPMGDEETRKGAFNRAAGAAAAATVDFAVGLEGGCAEEDIDLPAAGTPAAAAATRRRDLTCFAWMAVLEVRTGQWGCARTASFALPPAVAALVRGGMELGLADDAVFKRTNSKQEDGAVGLLTKGTITRTLYYEHAIVLALIPWIRPEHFGGQGEGEGEVGRC